jgi:hypothetical protein
MELADDIGKVAGGYGFDFFKIGMIAHFVYPPVSK